MTEIKHTPGPWYAVNNGNYWEINPKREFNDPNIPFTVGDVCASCPGDRDSGLQEANARLIAAAPDLLEKGLELASYANESKLNNTPEFMEVLFDRIQYFADVADKAKGGA